MDIKCYFMQKLNKYKYRLELNVMNIFKYFE